MPPKQLSTSSATGATAVAAMPLSTKPSRVSPWCQSLPDVIFDMIATMVSTRDRLLIIERTCRDWYRLASHGAGYMSHLDLSWLSPTLSWIDVVGQLGGRLSSVRTRLLTITINAITICRVWEGHSPINTTATKERRHLHRQWIQYWGQWPALQRLVIHLTNDEAAWFQPGWIIGHDITPADLLRGDHDDDAPGTDGAVSDKTMNEGVIPPLPVLDTLHLVCHEVQSMTLQLPSLPSLRHFRSIAYPDVPPTTTHTNCTIVCRALPSLITFVGGTGHRISCGVPSGEPKDWHAPLLQSLTLAHPTFYHHWYTMIAGAGASLLSLHDRLLSAGDIDYIRQHAVSLQELHVSRFYRGDLTKSLATLAHITSLRALTCDRAGGDFNPRDEVLRDGDNGEPKHEWRQLTTLTQLQSLNVIDYDGDDEVQMDAIRDLARALERDGRLTRINGQLVAQWIATPAMNERRLIYQSS